MIINILLYIDDLSIYIYGARETELTIYTYYFEKQNKNGEQSEESYPRRAIPREQPRKPDRPTAESTSCGGSVRGSFQSQLLKDQTTK